MLLKEQAGMKWLEFFLFQAYPQLRHGIFLKEGGFSTGPYSSLNMSYSVGDQRENVAKNIQKAKEALGLKEHVVGHLTHGNQVAEILTPNTFPKADALTTKVKNIALLTTHADCQVGLFYDPIKQAIATVHSGWRGNVLNIYQQTVAFMQERFQTDPHHLLVGIGPSLGPTTAEFIHYRDELPSEFWSFETLPNHFDFWQISRKQLLDIGIQPQHIEIANLCTKTQIQDFYSYRREKVCGRNGTLIALV